MYGVFSGQSQAGLARAFIWLLVAFASSPLAYAWRLEAGQASTFDTFSTSGFRFVAFQEQFDVPPIVVVLATDQGGDPSDLRIRNVTVSGFEVAPFEPTGNDGPHVAMDFDYIAAEPGSYFLPNGDRLIAGSMTTAEVQRAGVVGGPNGYENVPLGVTLTSTPTVLASIQSTNSEPGITTAGPSVPWLTPVANNVAFDNFDIALERSEVAAGSVVAETIGYIVLASGSSGSFDDTGGTPTEWAASNTSDSITGSGNGCTNHTFSTSAFSAARVVATKTSRDGGDGGWLRQCSLNGTEIGLQVEEDIANDTERNHTTETASVLAFSRSFHASFNGELTGAKTVSIEAAPGADGADPLSIPGARVRYALEVSSVGNTVIDPDTIELVDALPDDVRFVISDIDGVGSGPVRFSNGAVATGLTYSFANVSSTTDDLDFSTDGTDFTYVPILGADGTDPAISHIRVRPKGIFAPQIGAQSPSFTIEFDAIVE